MKQAEIKKNIFEIAGDVFKDTLVLFARLYGGYAVDLAHPFSDLDIGIYVAESSQKEMLNLEMSLALAQSIIYRSASSAVRTWRIISSLHSDSERQRIMQILLPWWRNKAFFNYNLAKI